MNSATGKKQGSVDGVIIESQKEEKFLEALNLSYLNKKEITSHMHRLEKNYDSKGIKEKYLIVYFNLPDNKFEAQYIAYKNFIEEELNFIYQKTKEIEEIETLYTNNRVLKTCHNREGKEVSLYHVLLKFPAKSENFS